MFRYERPQAGRQRQFHQIGVECLGVSSARGDVEVIALAWDLLADLGVRGLSWRSTASAPQTTASVIAPNWWLGCRSGRISSIPTLRSV